MINWSINIKTFKKNHPKDFLIWRLSQLINYGLDNEKLDKKALKSNWAKIKSRLDPQKAVYLEFLLWNIKPSSQSFSNNFWK